jgi:hypothetical protein
MIKKIIIAIFFVALIVLSIFLIPDLYFSEEIIENNSENISHANDNENEIDDEPDETEEEVEEVFYLNTINIEQSTIQLNSEAVQYRIKFKERTTLSLDADISFSLTEEIPVFYLIHFTDGKETYALHLSGDGRGKIDFKVINKNIHLLETNIEKDTSLSEQINIEKGSVWYLTIAIAKSIENERVSISLYVPIECMEIEENDRTEDVFLFSTSHHPFDKQKIFKRGILFNIYDGEKQFPISNGGMICVDAVNHIYGEITVGNNLYFVKNYNKKQSSVLWTTRYGIRPDTDLKYWYVRVDNMGLFSPSVLALVVDMYFHSEYVSNDCKDKEDRPIENKLNDMVYTGKQKAKTIQTNINERIEEFMGSRQEVFIKRIGIAFNVSFFFINTSISLLRIFINILRFFVNSTINVFIMLIMFVINILRWGANLIKN